MSPAADLFTFIGGEIGNWKVARMESVVGTTLEPVARVNVYNGFLTTLPAKAKWILRGLVSYERYVTREEKNKLASVSPPLGRMEATCAALIPIHKSSAWWVLTPDERRTIFEERSHHIATGLKVLPAVARRLHHSRDLGEPFDFVTWFEYAPKDSESFEELVMTLRRTEEWTYVDREIDIRLVRDVNGGSSISGAVEKR